MKILLLEDDAALNRAITKVTNLDGHTTTSYTDGQSVLDNLETYYDLYILDINVPNIDGLELLKMIYEQDSTSKVIIISANTDINSLKKAYSFGCLDYLKKPFHLEELRIKITKIDTVQQDILSDIQLEKDKTLTKKEKLLIELLLSNKAKTVNYEMIEDHIYRDKSMTMDSLRSLIRRLKSKLKQPKIENVLDEGYIVR